MLVENFLGSGVIKLKDSQAKASEVRSTADPKRKKWGQCQRLSWNSSSFLIRTLVARNRRRKNISTKSPNLLKIEIAPLIQLEGMRDKNLKFRI